MEYWSGTDATDRRRVLSKTEAIGTQTEPHSGEVWGIAAEGGFLEAPRSPHVTLGRLLPPTVEPLNRVECLGTGML